MAREGRVRPLARRDRGPPALGVQRGPADRQRHARHPPRRGARVQGRLPALPDDEGLPRPAQGRLGLPRPPGRARGREGARLRRQEGHRGLRHRGVQREVPRVGAAARRRVRRPHRAHGLLGRHGRRLLDHGPAVRRERVVVAQADLRQGPARAGPPGLAVLPAVRHGAVRPRARAGLRDGRRPVGLRPHARHRGRPRRPAPRPGAARLDHDAVDARVQHRVRGEPRRRLRRHPHGRRRDAARRGGAARRRARRGLHGARDRPRRGPRGDAVLAAVRARRLPRDRRAGSHRARGRLRDDRGRLGHRARGAGVRRRGPRAVPHLRPPGREPAATRRHVRARRPARRRHVLQEGRRRPRRRPAGARAALPARAVRALLPALLAVPHAARLLRAAVLVHPHDRGEGRPARRERGDRLAPEDDPVGSLRRLAAQQHRLGAVAQPLLGHSPADLALRGRSPRVRRVARRPRMPVRGKTSRTSTRTVRSSTT